MSRDIATRDYRTLGVVLRRTNFGEADRILNIITPDGKISAIAKGARKEKSRLAGGIEMFSLVDLNIHQGKGDLGVVTGAKMVKYYKNILKDFDRMGLAAISLKRVNAAAEYTDNPDFFVIIQQMLEGLDSGVGLELAEAWFWLNLARARGEEVNLYRDASGEKLDVGKQYDWGVQDGAFISRDGGEYGVNEIKLMRLMSNATLDVVRRVRVDQDLVERILRLARVAGKV